MADDVKPKPSAVEAPVATPVDAAPGTAAQPAPGVVPHATRFRLAYFALAIVLGAGVGLFVLMMGGRGETGPAWSSWKPTKKGEARTWEIADHVSARYRHESGNKLVAVSASPPVVLMSTPQGQREQVPIGAIVIRGRTTDFSDADISRVRRDDTVLFALCGGGERCQMDEGTASRERGTLLRREVLELALYAYKYVEDVDSVVTLLPPAQATNEEGQPVEVLRLVYFRKGDLDEALSVPLERLLPGRPSLSTPAQVARRVDRMVLPHQYRYSIEPGQQGDALLILSPFTG